MDSAGALMPRATRRCGHRDCDNPMPCATHARKPDFRPRRQERGYDAKFEAAKKTPAYKKATRCETCNKKFTPENPKTAGHRKDIRAGGSTEDGIFPECRRCNYGWRRAQEA